MMRLVYTLVFFANLITQISNLNPYLKIYRQGKELEMLVLLIIHWSSTLIIFMLLVVSFLWPKK